MKVTFYHDDYTIENEDYGIRPMASKYITQEAGSIDYKEVEHYNLGNAYINGVSFSSDYSDYEITGLCEMFCDMEIEKVGEFLKLSPLMQEYILASMLAEVNSMDILTFDDFTAHYNDAIKCFGEKTMDNFNEKLLNAANKGRIDEVRSSLKQGADVNAKNKYGATALIWAAWNGHTDIVELLLKHDADIDAKNKYGNTALMMAAWNGHTDMIELLLKHDANVNTKNKHGNTALIWATWNGHTGIIKLLEEYNG